MSLGYACVILLSQKTGLKNKICLIVLNRKKIAQTLTSFTSSVVKYQISGLGLFCIMTEVMNG